MGEGGAWDGGERGWSVCLLFWLGVDGGGERGEIQRGTSKDTVFMDLVYMQSC